MLEPSYTELMEILNEDIDNKNEINSRYTIVLAASKRARQLIDGHEPVSQTKILKPLSIAVDELYNKKLKLD